MSNRAPSSICVALLLAACGASEPVDPIDEVDAGPDPTPAFSIFGMQGELAIDEAGVRAEFEANGVRQPSTLILSLVADAVGSEVCQVRVVPAFVGFATRTINGRDFLVVQLDPGQGVVSDGCGWDEDHVQAELATMGPLEIGWASPAVADDWPRLDVSYNGEAFRGAGTAFVMNEDGTVTDQHPTMQTGALERGVYEL